MDVDQISSLPDDILQHILSFLETPNAAQTSLLSKRWRHLWSYTPALNFEIYQDFMNNHGLYIIEVNKICRAILQQKTSGLCKFRLCAHNSRPGLELGKELLAFPMKCKDQGLQQL